MKDRRLTCATALVLFLVAPGITALGAPPPAPPAPPPADAGQRLAGRALGATPLLGDVRELCDRVGGRPTGSPAFARAVEWGAAKLKAAGVDSVKTEEFTVPDLWLPEAAAGAVTAPEAFTLRLAASPQSPSTPGGRPLEARIVDVGEGAAGDFARLGAKAKGAVALVRQKEMKSADDLFGEYMRNTPLFEAARSAGVVAVLLQSTRPRGLLYRHPVGMAGAPAPMPAAVVSREHGGRIARLLEAGDVRVSLTIVNRTGPAYHSRNVVAEIRGREKPDEIVLLGAHLDSWELGTGANDNGVNAGLVIDVARGLASLGFRPRRTVRFVLFGGEEQGMWGSAGYVKSHAAEMGNHVAVVIFDSGSGRTSGFYLNGREELRKPLDAALAAAGGLGASNHTLEAIDGTDNFDFLLSGVPNIVASQDWAPYLPDYHGESDTFDAVDPREAQANAAIAAAAVWGLAESPERFGRRQTRAEVDKLLVDGKLVEQMKGFGQWEDWVNGKRGVSK